MDSLVGQTLVFIGSALVMVPIFQRLRFGSVLGYLLAGLIVGPGALGFIKDPHSVLHFAELGVVFLLFVIGLEIQPKKLWSMRRELTGLGGLQIGLCTAIFTFIATRFDIPVATSLVIGFALSLSSTAYALQTLMERGEFNTDFGRSSFAVLLAQDLVAIPALALIPLAAAHSAGREAGLDWRAVGVALSVIFALFIAGRYLIRPAFRLIAASRMREIFTAAGLFIVLGVAVLMQQIGLSAALGTFIAGVLLADSEYRHEIETNIEPFKSLLMGLFFMAVGMGVNVELLLARPGLVLGLAFGYLTIKGGVIYYAGRLMGAHHEKSKLMALTICQGGEFAFVILGMALQFGMAPPGPVGLLTVVITISMAISPLLNLASDQWRLRHQKAIDPRAYDSIEGETPQVIIAGYGRFGQIFGRILKAQDIPFVGIDHDPAHVELVRKFGTKIYYGDASREDLLESAGAARAKFFVLAIDDVDISVQTAKTVSEHFPHLKIFARARNRGHVFDLMDLGITEIKRETLDSAVFFVGDLLEEMGFEKARAQQIVTKFKRHDELGLAEQHKVRNDDKKFLSLAKQSAEQLAQVLGDDVTKSYVELDDGTAPEEPRA